MALVYGRSPDEPLREVDIGDLEPPGGGQPPAASAGVRIVDRAPARARARRETWAARGLRELSFTSFRGTAVAEIAGDVETLDREVTEYNNNVARDPDGPPGLAFRIPPMRPVNLGWH